MHRKVRQYLKKSLCGILSATMLLTSLSVPDNTVQAAEVSAVEETEMLEESAGGDETVESGESKALEEAAEPDVMNPSEETEGYDEKNEPVEPTETDRTNESMMNEERTESSDADYYKELVKEELESDEETEYNDEKVLNEETNIGQNVTLYVWNDNADTIPAIMAEKELTYIKEGESSETVLSSSKTDSGTTSTALLKY